VLTSAAGLAACTGPDAAPAPDPTAEVIADLWTGEQALVTRYRQVHAAFPALRPVLGGVLADHVAHVAALEALRSPGAASPTGAAGTTAAARPVPATPAAALADLARAERAAATAATGACLLAAGDTAALLASLAACEASHLVVLR
jgi:hypothetical protein